MTAARKTIVESGRSGDRENIYRHRHARLDGAGRYVRLIAEGGMGAILLVEGITETRGTGVSGQSALKLLKQDHLGETEAAARFRRELLAHRRLSHELQVPRLVHCQRFHDAEDPAQIYALFPYFKTGSLRKCGFGQGSPAKALRILIDAVEGLQSLHGHGYVHRDFCPDNILIDTEGGDFRGVLGDLGVGIFLEANTILRSDELEVERAFMVGHRGYIDPVTTSTRQSDLYSVGATLWWVLVGEVPPKMESGDTTLVLTGSETCREPLLPSLHGLGNDVLFRLTSPDLLERFPSARHAREALVDLIDAADLGKSRRRAEGVPTRRQSTRSRFVWAMAVAGVVIALLAISYSLWVRPRLLANEKDPLARDSGPVESAAKELPKMLADSAAGDLSQGHAVSTPEAGQKVPHSVENMQPQGEETSDRRTGPEAPLTVTQSRVEVANSEPPPMLRREGACIRADPRVENSEAYSILLNRLTREGVVVLRDIRRCRWDLTLALDSVSKVEVIYNAEVIQSQARASLDGVDLQSGKLLFHESSSLQSNNIQSEGLGRAEAEREAISELLVKSSKWFVRLKAIE